MLFRKRFAGAQKIWHVISLYFTIVIIGESDEKKNDKYADRPVDLSAYDGHAAHPVRRPSVSGSYVVLLLQRFDAWQYLPFEIFKQSPAACGYIADIIGKPELGDGCG